MLETTSATYLLIERPCILSFANLWGPLGPSLAGKSSWCSSNKSGNLLILYTKLPPEYQQYEIEFLPKYEANSCFPFETGFLLDNQVFNALSMKNIFVKCVMFVKTFHNTKGILRTISKDFMNSEDVKLKLFPCCAFKKTHFLSQSHGPSIPRCWASHCAQRCDIFQNLLPL